MDTDFNKIVILGLTVLLGYTIYISKDPSAVSVSMTDTTSSSLSDVGTQEESPLNSLSVNEVGTSASRIDDSGDNIDTDYLAFVEQRSAYQKFHNQGGEISAASNPYALGNVAFELNESVEFKSHHSDMSEREENFATEDLDWDQYAGVQHDE